MIIKKKFFEFMDILHINKQKKIYIFKQTY